MNAVVNTAVTAAARAVRPAATTAGRGMYMVAPEGALGRDNAMIGSGEW